MHRCTGKVSGWGECCSGKQTACVHNCMQGGRGGAGRGQQGAPKPARKRKEKEFVDDEPAKPWRPLDEQEVQDGIT